MNCIILIRLDERVVAVMDEDNIYEFSSYDAALEFIDNSFLCQAYPYQIVELDEL